MSLARLDALELWNASPARVNREVTRRSRSFSARLASLRADALFVSRVVHGLRPEGSSLPLFANLRCGAWHAPPPLLTGSCCFRSSDGHAHTLAFSQTRLNLPLLRTLVAHRAVIVVDATTKGKAFPDAFVRTLPAWAGVINALIVEAAGAAVDPVSALAPTLPPWLPPSAASRVADALPSLLAAARPSASALLAAAGGATARPIAVLHLAQPPSYPPSSSGSSSSQHAAAVHALLLAGTSSLAALLPTHNVIIALSASRCVSDEGDALSAEVGYEYGAGGGDDEGNWAPHGFTAGLFWDHAEELMSVGEHGASLDDDAVRAVVHARVAERGGGRRLPARRGLHSSAAPPPPRERC